MLSFVTTTTTILCFAYLITISETTNAFMFAPSMLTMSMMNRRSSLVVSTSFLINLLGGGRGGESQSSLKLANNGDDIPFKDGKVSVSRGGEGEGDENDNKNNKTIYSLSYRIYNPTSSLTPLVVVHGGP